MKLLVTGGAGFIGACFVNYWAKLHPSDKIIVVDNLTYAGDLELIRGPLDSMQADFRKVDICDYQGVKDCMHDVNLVVNFAAETHVDRSLSGLESEKHFFQTNVFGTLNLLYAAFEANVGRFHHVSTDEVFGDLDFDDKKFDEHTPYNPHNPYSISKASSDFALKSFIRTHKLHTTISNCSNNYGPYQTPEKLIPRSLLLLLLGKKIQMYTDQQGNVGKNVRDWLYVEDHCRAIEKIVAKGEYGLTYCVGGNNEYSNYELINIMLRKMSDITGQSYSMEQNVDFVKDRPNHDRRYAIDASFIGRTLGWQPAYDFEHGIDSTIRWYLSAEGRAWLLGHADKAGEVRSDQSALAGAK